MSDLNRLVEPHRRRQHSTMVISGSERRQQCQRRVGLDELRAKVHGPALSNDEATFDGIKVCRVSTVPKFRYLPDGI